MEKLKLGVIFGGMSTENEVSCVSGVSVIKNLNKEKYNIFPIYIDKNGNWFEVQNIKVTRFPTSHDCVGSSGYRFNLSGTCSVAVCTDLGFVSDEVLENLKGCRGMVIESNHDLKMLRDGPYPHELKLRVGSDHGHLSNNACAAVLPRLFKSGTPRFILGHISKQNNTHAVALSCAKAALMDIGAVAGEDYLIFCAGQYGCEEVVL